MKKLLSSAAVSAALALSASLAVAETADVATQPDVVVAEAQSEMLLAQAAQPRAAESSAAQRQSPARAFRMPSERVEARLAYAKTALKITDAQQPQWESFANVLRKHARDGDQRIEKMRAQREAAGAARSARAPLSAIERLERRQQHMTHRAARLNELIAAAKPLYTALSPEQKQIADAMLGQQRGGGRGHHHHQHRGMHRGA